MEELLKMLMENPTSTIAKIRATSKDNAKILNYRKEYFEHDRTQRDLQVGNIQKDKTTNKNKLVRTVKIPVNFAKKIVTTATAFEVGKPATLIPSEPDLDLAKTIKALWKTNRLDAMVMKMVEMKKRETQSAIQFYIVDVPEASIFQKVLTFLGLKNVKKEIKVKLLDNTTGTMTPYFNGQGDMILFMWEYQTKTATDKVINNVEVWDKTNKYVINDESGTMVAQKPELHGFDRIPMVYVSQDEPEWFVVKEMIDRVEVALSKLGASNDYSAYPILATYGEVTSLPDKDESGKVINFPIKPDPENPEKLLPHGDAKFITADNAVDSQKLEIESLMNLIHYISSTPNISFDNLKGLGAMSGVAMKLMFLDSMLKAAINEPDNRTMIERMINIITSGVVNVLNTSAKSDAQKLYFDIQFNSILPDDIKESVDIVNSAVQAGTMSRKTAVEYLAFVDDTQAELDAIDTEKSSTNQNPQ